MMRLAIHYLCQTAEAVNTELKRYEESNTFVVMAAKAMKVSDGQPIYCEWICMKCYSSDYNSKGV